MEICWSWQHGCQVDYATWAQGFLTSAAILASGWIAIWQARVQHKNAIIQAEIIRKEREIARARSILFRVVALVGVLQGTKQRCERYGFTVGDFPKHDQEVVVQELNRAKEDLEILTVFDFWNDDITTGIIFAKLALNQFIHNINLTISTGKSAGPEASKNFCILLDETEKKLNQHIEMIRTGMDELKSSLPDPLSKF